MTRAVLVNAYSYRNAGDAAIMLSTVRILRDRGIEDILLSTRYIEDREKYATHGVETVPCVLPYPLATTHAAITRALVLLWSFLRLILIVIVAGHSQKLARRIAHTILPAASPLFLSSGTVGVIAGGGYMFSSKRRLNPGLWHSLLTIKLCTTLADQTLMMPQSVGPLTKRVDIMIAGWVFDNLPSIVAREARSLERSGEAIRSRQYELVPDVAFYPAFDRKAGDASSKRTIRIVPMDWRWSSASQASDFGAYIDTLAEVCDRFIQDGYRVILNGHSIIPEHGQDDLDVCRAIRVKCSMENDIEIDEDCDVAYLFQQYACCDLVIGTRLHSAIMAVSAGTPAIALGYQDKTYGVYGLVGLADLTLRADSTTADECHSLALKTLTEGGIRERIQKIAAQAKTDIRSAYLEKGCDA